MGKLIFYHKHHPLSGRQWRPVFGFAVHPCRQKFPRALQRTIELNQFYKVSALARQRCAAHRSRLGLVLYIYLMNYPVAAVIIKHQPGVRCCGRRAGLFC